MHSFKLFLTVALFSFMPVQASYAECLNGESVRAELNRLQVGIEISLSGYPNNGRMIQALDKSAKNIDDRLCFTLSPKPVEIERGKIVQIEIFAVDKSGKRKKINGDKRLKITVSSLNLFFIDPSGRLVISPDPGKVSSSAFDVGDLQVEFQTENGEIGFNGLTIKIVNSKSAGQRAVSNGADAKAAGVTPSQPSEE